MSEEQLTSSEEPVAGAMVETPSAGLPEYVQRYLNGESIQDIAKDHNVAARSIYRWMMSELGDEKYRHAVTTVLVDRIADADLALNAAQDACQIARAREQARFARMDLERRRPNLYGQQRQQIAITGDNVQVNLVSYSQHAAPLSTDVTDSTEDANSK